MASHDMHGRKLNGEPHSLQNLAPAGLTREQNSQVSADMVERTGGRKRTDHPPAYRPQQRTRK